MKITGFLHDIGNAINRKHHAEYGAILANEILKETDLSIDDRVTIVSAIANHDKSTGTASDPSLLSADGCVHHVADQRRDRGGEAGDRGKIKQPDRGDRADPAP